MEGRGRKEEKEEDQSGFTVSCYVLFYDAQKSKEEDMVGSCFFFGGGYQYCHYSRFDFISPLCAKDLCTVTDSALVGKRITGRK